MAASTGFVELLKDALSGLGPMSVRRMFGGAGVYADGVMFGLIADDTLYLKADDATRRAFAAEGLGPFVYEGRGRTIATSYWRVPERLLEDTDEMIGVGARGAGRGPPRRGSQAETEEGRQGRLIRSQKSFDAASEKQTRAEC